MHTVSTSFEHDGCIIEEQEDHLVIAIRVPKTVVCDNLALLAAIADRSEAAAFLPRHSARAPPAWNLKKKAAWLAAAIVAVIAIPSPYWQWTLYASASPPVEYDASASRPAKASFKSGEDVDFLISYRRSRDCHTSFDRSIVRTSDNMVFYSARHFGLARKPSDDGAFKDYRLHIRLPEALPAGEYVYRGSTHSECGKDGAFNARHPEMAFTVTD